MITMSTYNVYEYLKQKFPELSAILKNGNIDKRAEKSIGVFLGSDTRSTGNLAIGGLGCTTVRMIPININIRWTSDQRLCDDKSIEIYNALLTEEPNIMVSDVKIAFIQLLDPCPKSLGRDDKNICETVIRANIHYYV